MALQFPTNSLANEAREIFVGVPIRVMDPPIIA